MKRYPSYSKYLSYITYILGISILFSSCITINKSNPSTIEEVSKFDNRRIIIETFDGDRYKLKWFEEKGDSIVSINNTKKIRIDSSRIKYIVLGDKIVTLDSAVNYGGIVEINTKNGIDKLLNIYVEGDQIVGLKKTGKEVLPLAIHKNQIKKMKVKSLGASFAVNALVGIAIVYGILFGSVFLYFSLY